MPLDNLQTLAASTLSGLRAELTYWKQSSQSASVALNESISKVDSITAMNREMGERMQARDEDLAKAYTYISALEKQRLKMIIVIIAMGIIIAGGAALVIRRKL
jgi:hypothetical protein